ncbi:hypothetical protein ACFWXA_21240 [Streptomyces atroolivaceus]|uniref:hypothetical protein n=1 Tax=Streptomyces atroolivaceus TaxID=66869 RepID=UPI00364E2784
MTGGSADLTHSPHPPSGPRGPRPPESADAAQWRLDHLSAYRNALPWPRREAEAVDTTGIPASRVAETVINRLGQQDG